MSPTIQNKENFKVHKKWIYLWLKSQ